MLGFQPDFTLLQIFINSTTQDFGHNSLPNGQLFVDNIIKQPCS